MNTPAYRIRCRNLISSLDFEKLTDQEILMFRNNFIKFEIQLHKVRLVLSLIIKLGKSDEKHICNRHSKNMRQFNAFFRILSFFSSSSSIESQNNN